MDHNSIVICLKWLVLLLLHTKNVYANILYRLKKVFKEILKLQLKEAVPTTSIGPKIDKINYLKIAYI